METLPAGDYYMGDPCYVIAEELWDKFCDAYQAVDDGVFEFEGHKVFVCSTQYGDGSYYDNLGKEYGVDAGIIGLIPVALCVKAKPPLFNDEGFVAGHLFEATMMPIEVGYKFEDVEEDETGDTTRSKVIYASCRRINT